MLNLQAADPGDQKDLDKETERFEKFFPLLGSDAVGERTEALERVTKSLARMNELMGKHPGQSGYFGMKEILEGSQSGALKLDLENAAWEIAQKDEIIEKLEVVNREQAEHISELQNIVLSSGVTANLPASGGDKKEAFQQFVRGGVGASLLLAIFIGMYGAASWVAVFMAASAAVLLIPLGLRQIGSFLVRVGDEARRRVALCADGAVAGLKAAAFSFILLLAAGLVAQGFGAGSLMDIELPEAPSGEGLMAWAAEAAPGPWGTLFLAAGGVFFFFLRKRLRGRSLPAVVEWIFF